LGLEIGDRKNLDAKGSDRVVQMLGEDRVTIVDQVPVLVSDADDLSEPLQCPVRTWVGGYVQMRQTARARLDDDEHDRPDPDLLRPAYHRFARTSSS
jgi:hypothetical protein